MLVSFSVSNFLSFRKEETFSLVASNRYQDKHVNHLLPIPSSSEKVLRSGAIYGANGAGKSNLLLALAFLRKVAIIPRPRRNGTRREPFRLPLKPEEPTAFDIQFISSGKLYHYGVTLDDEKILTEWLADVENDKEQTIFERKTDTKSSVVTVELGNDLAKQASEKLQSLVKIGAQPNQSFLATVLMTLQPQETDRPFLDALGWFADLQLIAPDSAIKSLAKALSEKAFNDFAGKMLKAVSTGVERLDVEKSVITDSDMKRMLAPEQYALAREQLEKNGAYQIQRGGGAELWVEKHGEPEFYQLKIKTVHQTDSGTDVSFELTDESDGTLRLLNLLPALDQLATKPRVFFIDEIDRSMHPLLSWEFIHYFLEHCFGGQLIVTTHECNLLDLDLLRRDEIWFAEKDESQATRLYSLNDFKVRKDLDVRKHYLQGRFGAIPFFGNIDAIIAQGDEKE